MSDDGSPLTVYGSTSPDRMGPLLANKWYQTNIGSLKASLTVVGDPTLRPWQSITVTPIMANGYPHRYSSGVYMIQEINDVIAGSYTTQMELYMMGETDGTKTLSLSDAVDLKGSV